MLESVVKEVELTTGKSVVDAMQSAADSAAYKTILEAWRAARTANLARNAAAVAAANAAGQSPATPTECGSGSVTTTTSSKIDADSVASMLENMQSTTATGRTPAVNVTTTASPYLPNAIFMGGRSALLLRLFIIPSFRQSFTLPAG